MNEDRIEGAATTMGGQMKSDLGRVAGDRKLQADGLSDKARGTSQNMFGGAQDALRSALDKAPPQVRDSADRAIAGARRNPLLAALAIGAGGLILSKIVRDTANYGRRNRQR